MPIIPRRGSEPYEAMNALNSSIQRNVSIKNQKIAAKNDTTNARIAAQRKSEKANAILQTWQGLKEWQVNAVSTGSKIIGPIAKQLLEMEAGKADAEMNEKLLEGDRIAAGGIENGSSGFKEVKPENPNPSNPPAGASPGTPPSPENKRIPDDFDDSDAEPGPSSDSIPSPDISSGPELEFQPSQDFENWYSGLLDWIDNTDYSDSTKEYLKQRADDYYWGKRQSMSDAAIEQAYTDYENAFASKMNTDIISDSKLWAQYGGNLPSDVTLAGIADIYARNDWSDLRKQTEAANYLNQVRYLAAQDTAVGIARTKGMVAADEYIQGLGFLSAQDKISLTALAQQSFNQMNGVYVDAAENLMTEAFVSGGSTPHLIYKEIDNIAQANNLPKETVVDMLDSAKKSQREAVQSMVSNQLKIDANNGYSAYVDTLEYLESGGADAWFYGLQEEKESAISQYKAKIAEMQENMATSLSADIEEVQEMDKDLLSGYKTGLDNDWNLFTSNAITGEEYMQRVTDRTTATRKQAQLPDTSESIIAAQSVAMDKVMGYIPTAYRTDIESTVESLLIAEGMIASKKSDRTPEEWATLSKAITATNGAIADAIFQYGTGVIKSPEDIYNFANKTAQAFILQNDVLGSDGVSDIPLIDEPGVTMKKAVDAAVDSNNRIVNAEETNYVYLDHSAGYDPIAMTDEGGNMVGLVSRYLASGEIKAFPEYRFLSSEAQEDFRRRVDVFESLLVPALNSSGTHITKTDIHSMPEVTDSGNTAIASPVMFAGGRVFRIRGQEIQETTDGNTWTSFATFSKTGEIELVGSSSDDGDGASRIMPEELSQYSSFIHIGKSNAVLDPEIVDMPGFNYSLAAEYIDSNEEYREYRDYLKDTLFRYYNNKNQGIPKEEW